MKTSKILFISFFSLLGIILISIPIIIKSTIKEYEPKTIPTKHHSTSGRIIGSYHDDNLKLDIKEVTDSMYSLGSSITSSSLMSSRPLRSVKAENTKLLPILNAIMDTEAILINNEELKNKRFNFELNIKSGYKSQDSIIADILLPLLNIEYETISIYTDSLRISIVDYNKLLMHEHQVDEKDRKKYGPNHIVTKKTNDHLEVKNVTLKRLFEELSKYHSINYSLKDESVLKIDLNLDLNNWDETQEILEQELGLQFESHKVKRYQLIVG